MPGRRRRSGRKRSRGKGPSAAMALVREPNTALYGLESVAARPSARRALESAILARTRQFIEHIVTTAPDNLLSIALAENSAAGTIARVLSDVPDAPIGITPDDLALAAARARGALRKQQLLQQAGGALTGSQLAELLGISRQAVSEGRSTYRYFGVPIGDRVLYPKFQLTKDGTLPGLREFLSAFPIDDAWAQLMVLLSASPRLGKRTPLEALKRGNVEAAVQVAARYGEHGG